MSKHNYQCCFCGKKILSNKIDITGLIVITNWDKHRKEQFEQQMFCHIKCLQDKLDKGVPLYVLDINE